MKLALLVLFAFAAVCALSPGPPRAVKYRVGGTAHTASVTYANEEGGTEQKTVAVPWEKELKASPGAHLYISAQNQGPRGSVNVKIEVEGRDFKTSTSDGAYAVATASASCCP